MLRTGDLYPLPDGYYVKMPTDDLFVVGPMTCKAQAEALATAMTTDEGNPKTWAIVCHADIVSSLLRSALTAGRPVLIRPTRTLES